MPKTHLNIMIGGAAGQGLATMSQGLSKALVRGGWDIVVTQSYHSRIRGGHNTMSIRISNEPIAAPQEEVDLLVALNQETADLHLDELSPSALMVSGEDIRCSGPRTLKIPLKDLSPKRYHNVVGLGVLGCILGLGQELIWGALEFVFKKMPADDEAENKKALAAAYAWAAGQDSPMQPLAPASGPKGRLMMGGNDAIALGAISAGVKFCSYYPMTPATSIALAMVANAERMGLVVEQAEDEIAAINMAIGASYAGAPALVPTSGGGFALMGEGISLAGMTETPVVVALAMRPGPATGLPTRTEQGDLDLALYAGHGEFPRAIFAPGDVTECFHLAREAVKQAEQFQSPVFILTDQFLADSFRAVEPFIMQDEPGVTLGAPRDAPYDRYAYTDSGVSPRAIPGAGTALVIADSDEHTPEGHITEDLDIRVKMMDKRLKKAEGFKKICQEPQFYGEDTPDILLVGWGSSKGSIEETVQALASQGIKAAGCHFSQVWPFDPDMFMPYFQVAGHTVCIEGNATGQFASLIRRETGYKFDRRINRYDGLPITPQFIMRSLKKRNK